MTTAKDIRTAWDLFELPEADGEWNDEQRAIITTMRDAHGEAWLGVINVDRGSEDEPVIWQWDGGLVYNFGAAFVMPAFDDDLDALIRERAKAAYTDGKADIARIDAIMTRVRQCQGRFLVWT